MINKKFEISYDQLKKLFGHAASKKVSFNYHEKARISDALDRGDLAAYKIILKSRNIINVDLVDLFIPVSPDETLARLKSELASPTLVRKDSRPRDRSEEIKRSLFGGFVFHAFDSKDMHEQFDRGMDSKANILRDPI